MKRVVQLATALSIAGVCCIIAAYYSVFSYTISYHEAVIGWEGRINRLEMRLGTLEAKTRELRPIHIRGLISTADRPADERMLRRSPSGGDGEVRFEAVNAMGGAFIHPELRLPVSATTNFVFEIRIADHFGPVADAWFSHAQPDDELAKFESFGVYCPGKTNVVHVVAQCKPDASVKMQFDLVVLCQQ